MFSDGNDPAEEEIRHCLVSGLVAMIPVNNVASAEDFKGVPGDLISVAVDKISPVDVVTMGDEKTL